MRKLERPLSMRQFQQKKFLLSEIKRIAHRLFAGSPGALVLNLVENEQLTKAELKSLEELIKRQK